MALYLRAWEIDDDGRPYDPVVYTPDAVRTVSLERTAESLGLLVIGECARWGQLPKLHHCDPRSMSERYIAVEAWSQLVSMTLCGTEEVVPQWGYMLFPRLSLQIPQTPPWDDAASPHSWVDPDDESPQRPEHLAARYELRRGHAWGAGPMPVSHDGDGNPVLLETPLEPGDLYLMGTVMMGPEEALSYTPGAPVIGVEEIWSR